MNIPQRPASDKPLQKLKTFLHDHAVACAVCTIVLFLWQTLLICKYVNLGYDDWDLAFFSQATANLLHGNQHVSIFGTNFFGNHANLIAYLVLPFYALCPHPMTLVSLKVLSLVLGGLIFYKIAAEDLGKGTGLLLLLLYFIYPPNIFAILYDFDYESLCPVFLFILYYFWRKERYIGFLITAILTMAIKENMPLIILAFAVLGFIYKKEKILWGGLTGIVALGVFYFLTSVFIPSFHAGHTHPYLTYYKEYGSSPLEVMVNILLHPAKIAPIIFSPLNIKFLWDLFSPTLFLSLGNLPILFLGSPILLQHLLAESYTNHVIYFQYGISIAPFLFLSLSRTLYFLKTYVRRPTLLIIFCFLITLSLLNLKTHWPALVQRSGLSTNPVLRFQWKMLTQIPKQEAAITTFTFLPELSQKENLYAFYKTYAGDFQDKENPFVTPSDVNYALIDFDNSWILSWYLNNPEIISKRIRRFYEDSPWELLDSAQETVLLRKSETGKRLIQKSSIKTWKGDIKPALAIDSAFSLMAVDGLPPRAQGNTIWPLKLTWHSLKKITDRYAMVFKVTQNGTAVYSHRREIGYRIYPTFTWNKDDMIEEMYSLFVPTLKPGQYDLSIVFVNTTQDPRKPIKLTGVNGEGNSFFSARIALSN